VRAVRFSFYPATPAFIFTLGGLAVVAACAARSWGTRGRPGEASLWVPLGRLSLTILFVHVIVFRQLAGMTGLTYRLSAAPALGITALVLGGLTWTASHWARADYPLSLEWLLRRLSRALARSGGPHQDSPSTSPAPDN
jgi:peptidoglycan/LPS O-acetylase OafA/YrhL